MRSHDLFKCGQVTNTRHKNGCVVCKQQSLPDKARKKNVFELNLQEIFFKGAHGTFFLIGGFLNHEIKKEMAQVFMVNLVYNLLNLIIVFIV